MPLHYAAIAGLQLLPGDKENNCYRPASVSDLQACNFKWLSDAQVPLYEKLQSMMGMLM